MPDRPVMIAVDWGTSTLRGYLLGGDGSVLARIERPDGILAAAGRGFERVLGEAVAAWRQDAPEMPILMAGMIGSRQGWAEAPYLDCPADADALAAALHRLDAPGLGDVRIVPGLVLRGNVHAMPDVMRGEETQVIGALVGSGQESGTFVLPGTHSKWVQVVDSRIVQFATYMTGEVFAALKAHTILGRLATGDSIDPEGFARGVDAAARETGIAGSLLNSIFGARSLALMEQLEGHQVAGYLSGLLIGAEIVAARPRIGGVTIIANTALSALYAEAAGRLGLLTVDAPQDCSAAGLLALARSAGLVRADRPARA